MPNHKKVELRALIQELREDGLTMPEIGRHWSVVELNGGEPMCKQHVYYYLKKTYVEEENLPDWM